VVNLSGRGDKDINTVAALEGLKLCPSNRARFRAICRSCPATGAAAARR
jgi:hypothetical protein